MGIGDWGLGIGDIEIPGPQEIAESVTLLKSGKNNKKKVGRYHTA